MAAFRRGASLVLLLALTGALLGLSRSNPLYYPDLGPNLNEEINDLLAALLEEQAQRDEAIGVYGSSSSSWPHATEVQGWSHSTPRLGQVGGITLDAAGRPVIFHRGPNVWLPSSFNGSHHFQLAKEGSIPVDTVLTLHPRLGTVVHAWGRGLFYLPHGIAICPHSGDIWLTDVALHQVFKFRAGETTPTLSLGEAFIPGSDANHFCKPSAVAISLSGDVFVADGYCNQRVMRFSSEGLLRAELGSELGTLTMTLPHAVALLETRDAVCVADREARRVVCMRAGLEDLTAAGQLIGTFQDRNIGPIYGLATAGGMMFTLSAAASDGTPAIGATIDPTTGDIMDTWAPLHGFHAPHALAVSPDGSSIYAGEIGPNRLTKFIITP